MKQILLLYFILSAILSYSQTSPSRTAPINADSLFKLIEKRNTEAIGKPFPEFSTAKNNQECSNSKLKGKIVFINFWFSSCAPCIAEFDELNKLYEKYKQNDKFEFVSFTFEDLQEIALIKNKYDIHYNVISISKSECYKLNFNNGFPTSIILDSTGTVKYIHSGGQTNKEEINKYFNSTIHPLISKAL